MRFSYGAHGLDALSAAVTLEVPAGKTVALVGASGAGKSTIMNLIPRFYDATGGAILVDGQDIRDVTMASLRGAIALVSQEVSLFHDTVRANIAYGRFGASEDEIVAAAKAAAADDFIRALPQGYDTTVGEHGVKLSGGQRQRLSIARAMLKNAPILLLDEATSALDTESERQVQAALKLLMRGRTTLVIAHRLSTVQQADIIYVVDDGRIVERGTHAELLLRRDGTYARLHALQFLGEQRRGATASRAGSGRQLKASCEMGARQADGCGRHAAAAVRLLAHPCLCRGFVCADRALDRSIGAEIAVALSRRRPRSFVVAFWHGRLLMMPYAWQRMRADPHADLGPSRRPPDRRRGRGDFGIEWIAGSSSLGGGAAVNARCCGD